MCVGFKTVGGVRKPCVRRGGKHGPIVNDRRIWWRVPLDNAITQAHVFMMKLSPDRALAWKKQPKEEYVVARDIEYVQKIMIDRYSRIVKRYTGLGKDAWSRAMMLASNRPANFVSGPKAKSILNYNVIVRKDGSGNEWSIQVTDNLRYATKALNGGEAFVNTAMMKAANAVNGMINRFIDQHSKDGNWFNEENWSKADAPFPPEAFGD